MASSPPSRRPFGRFLGASATAVVASVVLHGGAAAVALLVLPRVMSGSAAHDREEAPAIVDVNVVMPTEPEARPQSADVPRVRVPGRAVSQRRAASASARTERAPDPQPVTVASPATDLVPAAATPAPVARFALSAGSIAGRSDVAVAGAVGNAGGGATLGDAGAPLLESAVDVAARLVLAAPLRYPEAARRAEVELDLPLELVVSPQGRVVSAVALINPGYGLEEAAVAAVRSYTFRPARRGGREVAVKMKWTMQFRLH